MRVILDLCGGSASWSRPYSDDPNYEVILVDLVNGHDVRHFVRPDCHVWGILAAPPCTDLAASGARWWASKGPEALDNALAISDACLRLVALCSPKWWALENPKGRLRQFYGKPTLIFDPCDYGDPWTKKTLLWGKFNIPARSPVEAIRSCPQGSWLQQLSGQGKKTKELRSMTPQGFSRAFYEANP